MTTAAVRHGTAPLSARGSRTRSALLVAARQVFEERGYSDTRIADIAAAAGVSHGTVYTWFDSKAALLAALVAGLVDEVRESIRAPETADARLRVETANRHYVDTYRRNARLLAVVEQVALTDARLAGVLREMRTAHVARVARDIRRLQRAGVAAPDVDPDVDAAALTSMVEGYCRFWLTPDASGAGRDGTGDIVESLTALWLRAVGAPTGARTTSKEHS